MREDLSFFKVLGARSSRFIFSQNYRFVRAQFCALETEDTRIQATSFTVFPTTLRSFGHRVEFHRCVKCFEEFSSWQMWLKELETILFKFLFCISASEMFLRAQYPFLFDCFSLIQIYSHLFEKPYSS